MGSWDLLIEVVLLLGACLIAGGVFAAFRQSPLVGYLFAGMLMGGPGSFHVIQAEADIEAIAELGVALLLFGLGLEFSWKQLTGLGRRVLGAGVVQILATAAGVAVAGLLAGTNVSAAIALGAMVSLSSTAAVLRVLIEEGEIDSLVGRNSLAVLLVQDVAVVPLALLMVLLENRGGAGEVVFNILRVVLLALALIAGLYMLLNRVAVALLRRMAGERNRELTVLLSVVVGLGATWSAHAAGLSPALGAFVAGMFLGNSPFAMQVRADISSLQTVLLTLFFGAVGMVADPVWMFHNLGLVLVMAGAIILAKTLIVWSLFFVIGNTAAIALATGLCLSQVGEFAFVLATSARERGVIGENLHTMVVSAAILTLVLTPYLVRLAPLAASWLNRMTRTSSGGPVGGDDDSARGAEVLIVGFGPSGQAVGRGLSGGGRSVTVLDLNPAAVTDASLMGFDSYIGDATSSDVLEHLHVREARLVVVTLPARSAALMVMAHVRRLAPTATIIGRSRYQLHQAEFEAAGADIVVGDEQEVGRELAEQTLKQIQNWAEADSALPANE